MNNIKKLVATVLSICIVMSLTVGIASAAGDFMDVADDAWYAGPVLWAVENDITNGVEDGKFGPDNTCTRGQVVTFLYRAAKYPSYTTAKSPFKDVMSSEYFYKPVLWAVENGITDGVDEGVFAPENTVTRGQVVTFLYRLAGEPDTNGKNIFTDVSERDYFYNPVLWAVENGITDGKTDTEFAPNAQCTRAEVVTFLSRAFNPTVKMENAVSVVRTKTTQLNYKVYGIDISVTFTSSDKTVATVSDTGVVTGVKEGTATITATTSCGNKAECVVTVVKNIIAPTKLTLNKTTSELRIGEKDQLSVTISPENATERQLTWTSSDANIASVDKNGLVTAVNPGFATIMVQIGDYCLAACQVTVFGSAYDYLIEVVKETGDVEDGVYGLFFDASDGSQNAIYGMAYDPATDSLAVTLVAEQDNMGIVTMFQLNRDTTKKCTGECYIVNSVTDKELGSTGFSFVPGAFDQKNDKKLTLSDTSASLSLVKATVREAINLTVYGALVITDEVMFADTPYSVKNDLGFANYYLDMDM